MKVSGHSSPLAFPPNPHLDSCHQAGNLWVTCPLFLEDVSSSPAVPLLNNDLVLILGVPVDEPQQLTSHFLLTLAFYLNHSFDHVLDLFMI